MYRSLGDAFGKPLLSASVFVGLIFVLTGGSPGPANAAPNTTPAVAHQPVTPLLEHPTELRHAYALDLLGLQLDITELGGPDEGKADEDPDEIETGEEGEGLLETALPLLAGSLAAADAELLGDLETMLSRTGEDTDAEVRQLLRRAERVLVPETLLGDPVFRAARLALLASSEPGVGEGYEEAAGGEAEAYIIGYTGLQRITALWRELKADLEGTDSGVAEVDRALGVLGELMPSAIPPERLRHPEDAEVAVNDVVFGLESLTGVVLIPRDFGALLDVVGAHVDSGCGAAEAGHPRLALEWSAAATFFYDGYLAGTLATLAPEAHAQIGEDLGALVVETNTAPDAKGTRERCSSLKTALTEASRIFGG